MMALRMSPQPIMIFGKTIQTDSYGMQSGSHETLQTFLCQIKSIGDHAPRITTTVEGQPDFFQVFPHQGFSTSDDDTYFIGIYIRSNGIDSTQKIFSRHIFHCRHSFTVTSAMLAVEITAQSTLPEELLQRVQFFQVIPDLPVYFQSKLFT